MAIEGKNSDLFRRLRYYGFGLLLGVLAVSVLYKGKGCQLPGSAKMEELSYQKLELTQHGECRMACRGISLDEIKALMKSGKVNYDKSEVRAEPCGKYAVEGTTADGQSIRVIIADCDTISKVVTAIDLKMENDTCDCK
ncbi:MAG: DUF4258 domain-containing protein [Bacteroidetes bacterium]|jgi:hypothetical protein|nr:DUF4258 domain-containing protein [Bacteroidota bacterium]